MAHGIYCHFNGIEIQMYLLSCGCIIINSFCILICEKKMMKKYELKQFRVKMAKSLQEANVNGKI